MDITAVLLFVAGCVLLVFGAELLVNHASSLAKVLGIPSLIIGLTVVAYGTSSPELTVSIQSSFAGQADLALGNVVGSNIANVLLILGLSAVISPLTVSRQLVRLEVPLMIGISFAIFWMAGNGTLGRADGILLFMGGLLYTLFIIYEARREERLARRAKTEMAIAEVENPDSSSPAPTDEPPPPSLSWGYVGKLTVLILVGLGLLVLGSELLIRGAIRIATALGVSELIIGLTIVAVGTSLPELATSIIACIRGEKDIAVGNVIGSNIFNILVVLGVASMIAPDGIAVAIPALRFDIPVMIAVAIACLPIFFTGFVVSRWEGALFLVYYAAYTSYLVLDTRNHDSIEMLSTGVMTVVGLLTLVALLFFVMYGLRFLKVKDRRRKRRQARAIDDSSPND